MVPACGGKSGIAAGMNGLHGRRRDLPCAMSRVALQSTRASSACAGAAADDGHEELGDTKNDCRAYCVRKNGGGRNVRDGAARVRIAGHPLPGHERVMPFRVFDMTGADFFGMGVQLSPPLDRKRFAALFRSDQGRKKGPSSFPARGLWRFQAERLRLSVPVSTAWLRED